MVNMVLLINIPSLELYLVMKKDEAEHVIKRNRPGSLEWIRGMKHVIDLEDRRIKKLEDKLNKKDIDKEQLASLAESKDQNIKLLKTHW